MATQDPNTWERFYLRLVASAKNDTDIFKAITKFHDIASNGTTNQLRERVRELAQTYGEQYQFTTADISDMIDEVGPWRDVNFSLTQPQTQQKETTQTQPFQLFPKKEKQPTGGGLPKKQKTEATEQILSIQEAELLQKFEEIDNMEPGEARDAAIEEFLNSVDAPSLLRGQHRMLLSHIQQLGIGEEDERHKTVREFLSQREEQIDKDWGERINEEEKAKRRQVARSLFHNPNDPNQPPAVRRRERLRDLIHGHQDEIHGAYGDLFEIEEIQQVFDQELYGKLLFGLSQTLTDYQIQQEQTTARDSQAAQQQTPPQANNQAQTGPQIPPRPRKNRKSLQSTIKNAGLRLLEKAGPEGFIAAKIIKHWKIILALIFLFVATVVSVIVLFITLVLGGGTNQPSQPALSGVHPTAPPFPPDLAGAIQSKFGITMSGYDTLHLQWTWDKFWEISNTNFFALTENRTIVHNTGGGSFVTCGYGIQIAFIHLIHYCDAYVRSAPEQNLFDVLLTHELSHTVEFTNSDNKNHKTELPSVIAQEGYVTYYAQLNCLGSNQFYEDYAEMLTYYLNPNSEQTTACQHGPNPYLNGGHPLYKALAQKILGPF